MQPTLFEQDYIEDEFVFSERMPIIEHPGHSLAAMRKPFIFWDGEGYTDEFGQHHYWFLANSVGDEIVAPPGRSIERWNIARIFHRTAARIPSAIHVGFALGYDFTCMLRSNGLSNSQQQGLYDNNLLIDSGFCWKLMMGKQLTVWHEGMSNQGDRFNLQDTWGFFQRSFVKALDEYFSEDWPYRDTIIEMKQQRAHFDREHDEDVKRYCRMELELGVMLMEELRNRLFQAGMPVSRWYGPGAIANGLLQKWKANETSDNLYEIEPNVAAAAQHAYAGGRFELVKPGHINAAVYQYDINSAYPFALSKVPNLADGEWRHINDPSLEELPEFSMVRIRWTTDLFDSNNVFGNDTISEIYPRSIPFPFWRRTPKGNIQYPSHGIHGWYWLPEVKAGIEYSKTLPSSFNTRYSLEEAYAYYPNTSERPYNTIPILYRTRQQLKANGNGAHIGIKLGLNSLYGKFAQQVGYTKENGRIPPYHNLAIAGYVTATCRAMMIEAMTEHPESVIAFETDGIFSMQPLSLNVGKGLGEWDLTVYDDMWYYQSGFRFGILDGEVVKPATRGIPLKDITLEKMQDMINNNLSLVSLKQTNFITMKWAMSMNRPQDIGRWIEMPRDLQLMCESPKGKRVHDPDCYMCDVDEEGIRTYRWDGPHVTIPATGYEDSLSVAHKVLWSEIPGVSEPINLDAVIEP